MDLNDIPKDKTNRFPTGVSEEEFNTEGEVNAFTHGLTYAQDIDVEAGTPFERDGKFVVRVKVGSWDEDEDLEDDDNE